MARFSLRWNPGSATATLAAQTPWPSSISASGRYVLDQYSAPWLMLSDQLLPALHNGSFSDISTVLRDRSGRGFNAIWMCLTPDEYIGASSVVTDNAGNVPFPSLDYSLTPTVAYWANVDAVVALAKTLGITMLLMPVQTGSPGGSLSAMEANGGTKCTTYGTFLGNRYKGYPNIIWVHGNDTGNSSSWMAGSPVASDNTLMLNIVAAIKATGDKHLHSVELNFSRSLSTDDPTASGWRTQADINLAYTYFQTYDCVLQGYLGKQSDGAGGPFATRPVFMGEANYEGANNQGGSPAGNYVLRAQNYWTMLSGAIGQIWGNKVVHHFLAGWATNLDTAATHQATYWASFFRARAWHLLVPDTGHTFLTTQSGGTYDGGTTVLTVTLGTWATAAVTPDGSLGLVYTPIAQTLTIDMTKMRGTTTAQWYDPSNNTYAAIGSFANTGTHGFVASGNNSDGNPDWVLVLTA